MRDSAEMLKERLRAQEKEMQRYKVVQLKNEAKLQHFLKISQKTIEDLKGTVSSKENEIRQARDFPESFKQSKGVVEELKKQLEKAVKDKSKLVQELKKTSTGSPDIKSATETKKAIDPRMVEALKKLKRDNENLKERITEHNSNNSAQDKDKELLVAEVKRLRDKPQSSKKKKNRLR
jgi:uncharacterized phage infection (PIP) family protein YhgE